MTLGIWGKIIPWLKLIVHKNETLRRNINIRIQIRVAVQQDSDHLYFLFIAIHLSESGGV